MLHNANDIDLIILDNDPNVRELDLFYLSVENIPLPEAFEYLSCIPDIVIVPDRFFADYLTFTGTVAISSAREATKFRTIYGAKSVRSFQNIKLRIKDGKVPNSSDC